MKLIKASYEILSPINESEILKNIELAGRTCYKSEDKITEGSAAEFVRMLIRRGHESVLEHEKLTVRFICDRGVSHELVRHRIASFSQESTRYCNYAKDGFGDELAFILPNWLTSIPPGQYEGLQSFAPSAAGRDPKGHIWLHAMSLSENYYKMLINGGWTPQQARSVLPNSLKTEVVVTANLREWRLIFKQRTSKAAHPQMQEIMVPLLYQLRLKLTPIFEDIKYEH